MVKIINLNLKILVYQYHNLLYNLYEFFIDKHSIYYEDDLEDLKNYSLSPEVISFYKKIHPTDGINLGADVGLCGSYTLKRENTECAPGAYLIKYGVFTFASTTGGNAICMDLHIKTNGEPRIIIVDHSVFSNEEIMLLNKDGTVTFEKLSYAVIYKYTVEISSTFLDFLDMLKNNKIDNIEQYLRSK